MYLNVFFVNNYGLVELGTSRATETVPEALKTNPVINSLLSPHKIHKHSIEKRGYPSPGCKRFF